MTAIEQAKRENAAASRKRYIEAHPWAKHRSWAASRAKRLGLPCELRTIDFFLLWRRDGATKLKRPSIDRIDPKKGYVHGNCRFIEESLNKSLGARSQVKTEKQRAASSKNLGEWRRAHPIPCNKKTV